MVKDKKKGFTLAEIMVTLSLIGFIATLTMSTLSTSIQQKSRLSEFRTAYSKMETALKTVNADAGNIFGCYDVPTDAQITDFGLTLNGTVTAKNTGCADLEKKFLSVMGVVRTCTSPVDEGCIPPNYPTASKGCFTSFTGKAFVLDNSMIMFTDSTTDSLKLFALDVNGRKGPNKWGQDIFPFSIKATESVLTNGKTFVTQVSVLPPTESSCAYVTSINSKTTSAMLKQSSGF
jgi:prepilin-type N-terminal cleavage/methylation domain-containing protein